MFTTRSEKHRSHKLDTISRKHFGLALGFAVAALLGLTACVTDSATSGKHSRDRSSRWVGAWAAGQQLTEPRNNPPEPGLEDNTLRQKVFPTLSGKRIRVRFSNEWGNGPVSLNAVTIAHAGEADSIDSNVVTPLFFDGLPSVSIPAGETRYSDPVAFDLNALESLAITINFGQVPDEITGHPGSRTTSYLSANSFVSASTLPNAVTADHWYYISSIDVMAPPKSAVVVALGDSITDGRGTTTNGNDRWTDQLARRLQANERYDSIGVINQGIGGNAVVAGGLGPTALDRFERDALRQPGARWVIIFEGVNDIGGSKDPGVADRLINAYEQLIEKARDKDLLVYGGTITPFGESFYDSEMHEAAREKVNKWIRESGKFDAVIDFARTVSDPQNPKRLLPAYDSGDHLHLSPAGYQAMASAIDLSLFRQ